ncbi:MAG TPA: hypothetical protein EYH31_01285 [Anaerolineae bacterium]|nr:hypothetical protein [Anaerolineae bacterium]
MDFREKQFYRTVEAELYATIEPLDGYVSELPFVLAHTGVQHSSGAVHKPIRERWAEGEPAVVEGYQEITQLALQGKKALLHRDWDLLGELMNRNHTIQRDLGGSGPENERLIQVALDAGAWGAKLAGAGDGGTIIALHPRPPELAQALLAAGAERILYLDPGPGVQLESGEISDSRIGEGSQVTSNEQRATSNELST